MLEGVDVSYAQGNYRPGSEDFVIVNASRANVGLVVGSQYRNQVSNARAAGKHVGHYFFNGNRDPVECANFFVNNLSYQPGDSLWLDVEAESGTGTAAWTPAQALAFINQVKASMGVTPGVYLNKSLMTGFNWSQVVATGAHLWIAYYNPTPPPISWWPTWSVWQYTSTPIDRNKAQVSLASIAGGNATLLSEPTKPPVRTPDMIAFQYDGTVPKGQQTIAAVDPANGTYRFPTPLEVSALLNEVNAGRFLVNKISPKDWTATLGQLREIPTKTA